MWHQQFRAGIEEDDGVGADEYDDNDVDDDGNPKWWGGRSEDDIREKQEEREFRRVNREARSAQRKVERMAAQVHRGFQDFVQTRMEIWKKMGRARSERREALMYFEEWFTAGGSPLYPGEMTWALG